MHMHEISDLIKSNILLLINFLSREREREASTVAETFPSGEYLRIIDHLVKGLVVF